MIFPISRPSTFHVHPSIDRTKWLAVNEHGRTIAEVKNDRGGYKAGEVRRLLAKELAEKGARPNPLLEVGR